MSDKKIGVRKAAVLVTIPAVLLLSLLIIFLSQKNTTENEDATGETDITTGETETTTEKDSSVPTEEKSLEAQVNEILGEMSLEEKVCQMFIITPEALTGAQNVTAAGEITKNALDQYPVGGLVYFADNIIDKNQITQMLLNTKNYAMERNGLAFFTCIDEEGGQVARIGNNSAFDVETFPDMAAIEDKDSAYHVGDTIGGYLSEFGFNMDFAPDADVLTNVQNTVIGSRSFGTDPLKVTEMAMAVAKGLNDNGVLAVFKHFPGHGATTSDTHKGFAYTDKSYEDLLENELVPFKAAADNNAKLIMVAHISVPNVVGDNTPSSLSKKMVTEILRNDFGYNGLVVTDAMNMGAITDAYSMGEAAIMAVNAGNDLLLMPADFVTASNAIINEVKNGNISEERINESVRRILEVKLTL